MPNAPRAPWSSKRQNPLPKEDPLSKTYYRLPSLAKCLKHNILPKQQKQLREYFCLLVQSKSPQAEKATTTPPEDAKTKSADTIERPIPSIGEPEGDSISPLPPKYETPVTINRVHNEKATKYLQNFNNQLQSTQLLREQIKNRIESRNIMQQASYRTERKPLPDSIPPKCSNNTLLVPCAKIFKERRSFQENSSQYTSSPSPTPEGRKRKSMEERRRTDSQKSVVLNIPLDHIKAVGDNNSLESSLEAAEQRVEGLTQSKSRVLVQRVHKKSNSFSEFVD